jgi:flagellar basal body-associated protein FliL
MADEGTKHKNQPARRRRSFAVAGAVLLFGAVAFWFVTSRTSDSSVQANDRSVFQSIFHLETFVLNVGGADQRAYLRVGIDLGLSQPAKRAEEAVAVAQVRDIILGVLGEAKADDLLTAGGKARLKQDLLRALQQRVPQLGAQEVYFTEFLVQR